MATQTISRPRIAAAPAGKSGSATLKGSSLVQDKSRREALRQKDAGAYLQQGGLQSPTTELTPELALQCEIADLFATNSWGEFSGL